MSVVVVLAFVLGGLGAAIAVLVERDGGDSGPSSSPTPTAPVSSTPADPAATRPPSPALAPFYSQQLDWSDCDDGHQCATLTVPVDYRKPGGDTIDLALLRVPAADPSQRIGSLVVNPGGPGAPGTSYAAAARQVFRQALTDHYDIVGFDPRGTGQSDPVDCLDDEQMDSFLEADPVPDDAAETQALVGGLQDFYAGCVANSDSLVGHVTTIEAARDMDVLRAALGETTMTYFGASYGTKLGATYADLFPTKVGRMVLDGAVDVALDSRSLSLGQAEGFERALDAYVQNCIDTTDSCFLGDTLQDGLDTITGLLDSIDQQPLQVGDRELTAGTAFLGLITPLYNKDYWTILSQALKQGLDGDGQTLLLLADTYASRNADGTYADNSAQAIYAINCLDDPYYLTADQIPAQYPDFEKASPTLGKVFAWGLLGCDGIQLKSTEKPRTIHAKGAAPIVVVGTTRDPATPYEWAVSLAKELDSGVLVSRDGDGHTGYNSGNDCVDGAVESYLVDGTVPEDGLSC